MKKIIVEYLVSSQKTAILEDDKLIELLIEDNKNSKKVSNISKEKKDRALKEVNDLIKEFNFNPTLYNLLKEDNLI